EMPRRATLAPAFAFAMFKRRLERVTRLELATSSLARRCSTTELHPHFEGVGIMAQQAHSATVNCLEGRALSRPKSLGRHGGRPSINSTRHFYDGECPTFHFSFTRRVPRACEAWQSHSADCRSCGRR